ncbi:MAG: outer membrane beta-barrel protein [Rhodocyclaceae bacterium]|nr:outer membrane beta-barrel protein [Rhodocyclaceae bacterium]
MTFAIQKLNAQTGLSSASRRQPWKVISFVASVAVLSTQVAHAQDSGWYAGAKAGVTKARQTDGGINSAFAGQGMTADTSLDQRDNIYSLNLGYQFHKNFALEGGYVDLGKYNFHSNISAPTADTASGDYRVKGWTASAVGILPLNNGFSAYGKLGAVFADTKFNAASDIGATAIGGTSKSSTRPLYGLGVSYDFTKQVVGKAEWTRYDGLGNGSTGKSDIDTYTVGVAYKF